MKVHDAVRHVALGLMLVVLTTACAASRSDIWPAASPGMEKTWAPADLDMVRQAVQAHSAEVRIANVAQTEARRDTVRELARRIVQHHLLVSAELAPIVRGTGVTPPESTDAEHVAAQSRLAALRGDAFDAAFLDEISTVHTKGIELLERIANTAADRDLRRWAERHLPAMREHLTLTQTERSRIARARVDPSASPKTR